MSILPKYEYFWVFLLIACLIPVLAITASKVVAPSTTQNPEKRTSYESGIEPMGEYWIQFQIRYYMFALVFVVFDVETVFLYPWALSFDKLGIFAFIEVLIFIIILIIGLVYAWRKGALEWS
jgi:NAD(P)H-quinone oxidoreductase subunit 3